MESTHLVQCSTTSNQGAMKPDMGQQFRKLSWRGDVSGENAGEFGVEGVSRRVAMAGEARIRAENTKKAGSGQTSPLIVGKTIEKQG